MCVNEKLIQGKEIEYKSSCICLTITAWNEL